MPLVHDLPPDRKSDRPRTRPEAIGLIDEIFDFNEWDESLQVMYLAELDLKREFKNLEKSELDGILKKWREFDNTILKRILLDMEKHRMILFK